ncbi:hypothetical protein M409DRAFT_64279 [Zasmidium cellare ATCC 36951]|uniref:AB hydrolase-1 domain-containing protein n=1 Tax=Zasmidium cellare ATCC 36951 TaxID=1080233 RepID=A0A6A6CWM3_ZASCE|nr:uncharacterized protein M409DRAFT_64279 [Zasmidium cellare ATCC 36951]KAF2170600.1 hypothetical protein M409DRAFT_64279 [Zasmidium cellare ATCC 36951]
MYRATCDGTIPFPLPSSPSTTSQTAYKIFGSLTSPSLSPPLIILHGGPGSADEYTLPLTALHTLSTTPIILYDQIGCGASTHHPSAPATFWTVDLFVAELENLLQHFDLKEYDILGHSFGGILTIALAAKQPPGLRRLILASASVDGELFFQGLQRLKTHLTLRSQLAIDTAVEKGDFTNRGYLAALTEFQRTFLCRAPDPYPPPLLEPNFRHQKENPEIRRAMQGLSPFVYDGFLRRYSSIPLLHKIQVPTLIFNGEFDTTQDEATYPLFEGIDKVRWVTLSGASHMPFLDSEEMLERVLGLVGGFLMQGK